MPRRTLRLPLEIALACGALVAWGMHLVVLLAAGIGGLVASTLSLAIGIALGAGLARFAWGRALDARLRFDAWLVAWWPAALVAAAMVVGRWPVRGQRTSAHGFGMSGGEVNTLLFPFLQVVFLTVLLATAARRPKRRREVA